MSIYIYLPYSLAFMALGFVMTLTARAPVPVLPRRSLWLLAAFGFLHGLHEWIEMAIEIQTQVEGNGLVRPLELGNLIILSISYALVMQSAVEMLILLKGLRVWLRLVPTTLLLIWIIILVVDRQRITSITGTEWINMANALGRYLLGVPGALLLSYSLLVASRSRSDTVTDRIGTYFTAAAIAFAGYAIFTAVGVPPAPFPPASLINHETFLAVTHIPVEALRAIFALAFAGFMAEACIVEAARNQAELERLREEFISIVAHDLRAPIATIRLGAGILEKLPSNVQVTDRERTVARRIDTSARSLGRIVEDLLDLSRIETNRLALEKENVDLRRLIYEVVDRTASETANHPLRVFVPDVVPTIRADPMRIEQIITNLLSNAAKYSDPETEIRVELTIASSRVEISVTNQGRGIAPEDQHLIFTRFYRTRSVERSKTPGLGLGLYISKGLIEAHGGRIWVDSEVGRTTSFRFTLPRP